jgi:ribonucleotide reductase beta subunit family protein with ferritin-like domain
MVHTEEKVALEALGIDNEFNICYNTKMKSGNLLEKETAGVNQILPHKHKWAWELYEQAIKNNWVPTEVPMVTDVQNWKNPKSDLSEDERLVVKRCLGFFAGSE